MELILILRILYKFFKLADFKSSNCSQSTNPHLLIECLTVILCHFIRVTMKIAAILLQKFRLGQTRDQVPLSKREDHDYQTKELKHKDLKDAVEKRDGVCLFCWNKLECEGAYIIAQRNIQIAYDERNILTRAGLSQKHQINNGLLLCQICHSEFDKLKQYVDVVDDKLVVKVVNETDYEANLDWRSSILTTQSIRTTQKTFYWSNDNRQAVETNGEMALYFINTDPNLLPNRKAQLVPQNSLFYMENGRWC
jgi:hypothetical protein